MSLPDRLSSCHALTPLGESLEQGSYYPHWLDNLAGDYDGNAYIEEYSCNILGHPTRVVVTVHRNDAGKTQALAVLHRPNTSVVVFSRAMHDKFADTPLAEHFLTGEC